MRKNKKGGFTLVELVIVIAVIAILAAVLIPTFITVIDSANNSADLQLVTNMNTVVLSVLDDSQKESAQDLRRILKDNGIDNIATKKDENLIVFDKEKKQFEILKIGDVEKLSAIATVAPLGKAISLDSDELKLTSACYSGEEMIDGKIIVSTSGNYLSEAIYAMHNLSSTVTNVQIENILYSIKNDDIKAKAIEMINSCAYLTVDGEVINISVEATDEDLTVSVSNGAGSNATRLIFNENATELDLSKLGSECQLGAIIPSTVTTVTGTLPTGSQVVLSGNVNAISDEAKTANKTVVVDDDVERAKGNILADEEKNTLDFYFEDVFYVFPGSEVMNYNGDIAKALSDAAAAHEITGQDKVVLLNGSTTLDEDATIDEGVTLEIPFAKTEQEPTGSMSSNYKCYNDGAEYYLCGEGQGATDKVKSGLTAQAKIINDKDHRKFELIVDTNATLTVKGKVRVGSVISYSDQKFQGHTSGDYGQITNNGNILVENNAVLDVWGYVTGTGSVTANNGAKVYEPFIVSDFKGGTNTASYYRLSNATPFSEYAVINIQCTMTVNYGAALIARCNLYASDSYNRTDANLISNEDAIIKLTEEGSFVKCEYASNSSIKEGIGKTTLTIGGAAETGALSLTVMSMVTVSTDKVVFPIPYNYDIKVDGKLTVKNSYAIMPGASVMVNQGGTLEVADGAKFYALDWYYPQTVDKHQYVSASELNAKSYNIYGDLTVNGTMIVNANATVGGIVRSTLTGAMLDIKAGAIVTSDVSMGGVGGNSDGYHGNDINIFNSFTLRALSSDSAITELKAGTIYKSDSKISKDVDLFDIKYLVQAADGSKSAKYYKGAAAALFNSGTEVKFNETSAPKPENISTIAVSGGWVKQEA